MKTIATAITFLCLAASCLGAPIPGGSGQRIRSSTTLPLGLASGGGGGTTQLGSDNFNRANETPLGGVWLLVGDTSGNFNLSGNSITPADLTFDDSFYLSGVTWPNDQWGQVRVTVTGTSVGTGGGLILRGANNGGARTFYRVCVCKAGANNIEVHKHLAGVSSTPGNLTTTWVDGDVLQGRCTGGATTSISVYQNGNLIGTVTDSSSPILSGNVGVGFSSTSTACTLDDFAGGSVP